MARKEPLSRKEREQREAELLRANLRKRKEQQRAWGKETDKERKVLTKPSSQATR